MVRARTGSIAEDTLIIELSNHRTISAPLNWYPRLLHGIPDEIQVKNQPHPS
jgi:hypothetical protein